MRGRFFRAAHRPFPSMIIATCLGRFCGSSIARTASSSKFSKSVVRETIDSAFLQKGERLLRLILLALEKLILKMLQDQITLRRLNNPDRHFRKRLAGLGILNIQFHEKVFLIFRGRQTNQIEILSTERLMEIRLRGKGVDTEPPCLGKGRYQFGREEVRTFRREGGNSDRNSGRGNANAVSGTNLIIRSD